MSKPLPVVLVTGATGHIGFRALAKLLEAGYRARVTSCSLASAEKLKDHPSIEAYADSAESFEVSDFLADGALDDAVRSVDYILHLASPLPDERHIDQFDLDAAYIEPAIQGTVGMLKAASKFPSVKGVVITASINILAPQEGKTTSGPNHLAKAPSTAEMQSNPWIAYQGSKVLAHEAAERYVANDKPGYDVVYILPEYVQPQRDRQDGPNAVRRPQLQPYHGAIRDGHEESELQS